jgi:acetyl-CoA carboxylase beta subunit
MFPATGTSRADNLSEVWTLARMMAAQVRMRAASLSASAAGASTSAAMVLDFATFLADARFELNKASQVAGIGAYAQAQINDATVNVATEFNAMMSAIDAVTASITGAFPKDAQGRLLFLTFTADGSGRNTSSAFTAAQMASVKIALDALVATISA